MKACIASYYMPNIDKKTVRHQNDVIEKYNKSDVPFYCLQGQIKHGHFIDYFWKMNGVDVKSMDGVVVDDKMKIDYDVVVFMDIDAIPLHEDAIDYLIDNASKGKLIGDAQRTGHIENNNHVFIAPSAMAISRDTFIKIGAPSAIETDRSDVMEEYTWEAELVGGIEFEFIYPTKYDKSPHRYDWEKDRRPYWSLENGLPNYGIGTTFGNEKFGDMFYHNFQIFQPGHQEMFWRRCELEMNK